MTHHPYNILVAGTPGAYTYIVARHLARRGWSVLWPGQEREIEPVHFAFQQSAQNYEAQRIHERICANAEANILSDALPTYYDMPYPGPQEFIQQFGKANEVVISAPSISPFLDIWLPTADIVIDIQATEEEDLRVLAQWTQKSFPENYLRAIRRCYLERYNRHLKLFPRVITLANADVALELLDPVTALADEAKNPWTILKID